jgi:arylsulfatase A-like enzyme
VDSLIGKFLDALKAAGRLDKSVVIITGDHGEAFWEHGVATHGSNLGGEQLDVAFAMRLPGEKPRRFEGVFSLLDVMPTVLAGIGCEPEGSSHFAGVPLQKRLTGPGTANGALTFQGWNERAFRFVLTCGEKRVLLELDQANPRRARRLAIKGVSASVAAEALNDNAGRELLSELPLVMKHLPFLEFR